MSGCIIATKGCIDNRIKLDKQQYLLHIQPFGHSTPTFQTDRQDRTGQRSDSIGRTVFGRPFVKRFALCYRSVFCLSCPVCDVRALWPNGGRIKMKLGMQVGLGPGDFVLDGDPAPLPKRGGGGAPHIFGPMFIAAKQLNG